MPVARPEQPVSDSRRDARRYHSLLLALHRATAEIGHMEDTRGPDLGEVMCRLLPAFCESLDAKQGFVAVQRSGQARAGLEVRGCIPATNLIGASLAWTGILQRLNEDGEPRVVDSLDGEAAVRPVPGLELFGATSAVVVRTRGIAETWVVGVCNHRDPLAPPYLAIDGKALDNMIELVTIGARVGERQRQHWQGLHEASKAIADGFTARQKPVLDRIVAQAVQHSVSIVGDRPVSGIVQLYDEAHRELRFESVYPPDLWQHLLARFPDNKRSVDPQKAPGGEIGITGKAVAERRAQRIPDVTAEPAYVAINEATRSELAVPLLDHEKVIGVLSLESSHTDAFDATDEMALAALAELAVIAIRNATQAGQLSQANAVAMMGAWGAILAHTVNKEVGLIRLAVGAIEQKRGSSPEVKELLQDIDRYAGNLAVLELPRAGAPHDQSVRVSQSSAVDKVVQSEVESFQRDYPAITWTCELACTGERVAMHEQWLRQLLRLLMHNAFEALKGSKKKARSVIVQTARQGNTAEIRVEDSGPGVPKEVLPLLFQQAIPNKDAGRGQGLLLARFVAEQYGGTLGLSWSRPGEGSCFAFSIPTVRRRRRASQARPGN